MLRKTLMAGAVLAVAGASSALATLTLQIDVNGLSAQAKDSGGANSAFSGINHTGSIALSNDSDSVINSVGIVGGSSFASGANGWVITSFTGSILLGGINPNNSLAGGQVIGGSFSITVRDGNGAGTEIDSYSASIVAGSGVVVTQAGQGFSIDGLTFVGTFTDGVSGDNKFAGFDISQFLASNGSLGGSFINFAYSPDAGGHDDEADMDIFINIPLPTSAGLATLGLAGLAGVRRRR